MQLGEVRGPALGQVAVRLRRDPDRHRGHLHQLGVGLLLATEHDHRRPGLADPLEARAQVLRRAEDPADHEVAALEHLGHRLVGGPGRVGPDVVGARGACGEQVGVGGRQECDLHVSPWGFSPLVGGGPVASVWLRPRASIVLAGRASQWRNRPGLAPGSCPTRLVRLRLVRSCVRRTRASRWSSSGRPSTRCSRAIRRATSGSTRAYQTSSGCTLTTGAWLHGNWQPVWVISTSSSPWPWRISSMISASAVRSDPSAVHRGPRQTSTWWRCSVTSSQAADVSPASVPVIGRVRPTSARTSAASPASDVPTSSSRAVPRALAPPVAADPPQPGDGRCEGAEADADHDHPLGPEVGQPGQLARERRVADLQERDRRVVRCGELQQVLTSGDLARRHPDEHHRGGIRHRVSGS